MLIYFLVCLLLGIVFGGAYYAYRITFYSPMNHRDRIPIMTGKQYDPYRPEMKRLYDQLHNRSWEPVFIQSQDGLTLFGRYYHVREGAPLDIGFHGYRSSALTDFSGGSELSVHMGHNLLLVDQRAHGKSQGRTIAFGIQERQDCLQWINYAVERFGEDVEILLFGISMGGATVLMAAGLELPPNVKGIIADCPYASARDIICTVAKKRGLPAKLLWPFVKIGAKVYGGFDLEETDATESVKAAKVPILIIHGESDSFVPMEMSDLAAHNPQMVTRVTFSGADHGTSYLVDRRRYQQTVSAFLDRALSS